MWRRQINDFAIIQFVLNERVSRYVFLSAATFDFIVRALKSLVYMKYLCFFFIDKNVTVYYEIKLVFFFFLRFIRTKKNILHRKLFSLQRENVYYLSPRINFSIRKTKRSPCLVKIWKVCIYWFCFVLFCFN